jgi:hypothetical protein
MKRLTPNHLKVMLDLSRSTGAISIADVARIVLEDAGFTKDEIDSLGSSTKAPRPATERKPRQIRATKKGSTWTKADDKTIVDLWADGYSASQIAKQLRRTKGSVTVRISQLRKNGAKIEIRNAAAGQRMKAYHGKRRATSKK